MGALALILDVLSLEEQEKPGRRLVTSPLIMCLKKKSSISKTSYISICFCHSSSSSATHRLPNNNLHSIHLRHLILLLRSLPIVFSQYRGISTTIATLPYIGLIVGALLGCDVVLFEPRYNRKPKENKGIPVLEQRLLPMMVGATLLPIGLFWFTWTGNYPSIHWIVPTLSGLLTMLIFLQALNYLIDAYLIVDASAIAANTFLRSFFGAGFPQFATQMFDKLGVQ